MISENRIKNIKLLVVEDMPLNQLLMKVVLDGLNIKHDITSNGKLAIQKLFSSTYDLVLMDLYMPDMDGFVATEHIRKVMLSNIPIIALTADIVSLDAEKCKVYGFNDYLSKPVDEQELYNKIMALINPTTPVNAVNGNSETKSMSCIDLSFLKHRTGHNEKLLAEMISLYLEQTQPLIQMMKQSVKDKNWNLLQNSVHKMIPSFTIMGINKDFELLAQKIHQNTLQNHTDTLPELVLQFESVTNQVCQELEQELAALKMRAFTPSPPKEI
ncbi:MAG: response regulator [Bacteroidetes bacterium]|nr:response regulator [Bacteroidota bacterium]